MNGLCYLAIACCLYCATLRMMLSSLFAFIIKALLPILMCKMQVASLHYVLKQNTGAYCSAHNLLIPSLSKSLYSLHPVPSHSHQAASTSVCWGLGWWLLFFLFCVVWCTVTCSVSKARQCCLRGSLYLQRPWALCLNLSSMLIKILNGVLFLLQKLLIWLLVLFFSFFFPHPL